MEIGYAIYRDKEEPRIGLTLPPTPDLSVSEVHSMIDILQTIVRKARDPENYTIADVGKLDDRF